MVSNPEMILTKADIEQPRSPDELFGWSRLIPERFGETPAGKTALRLNADPLIKIFKEEIWPLASYAHLFYGGRKTLRFRPKIGGQRYDALLETESGKILCHVEITLALDGPAGLQERLRMEHLDKYGHAPGTSGSFSRRAGTRHVIEASVQAVEATAARDKELKRVSAAAKRKAGKSYPVPTALVIEYQGTHVTTRDDEDLVRAHAMALYRECGSAFSEVAIVDDRGAFGARYPESPL